MIIYLASSPSHAVFFPDVGGATLDSHHGFVVEYGKDWDVDLGVCFNLFLLHLIFVKSLYFYSFFFIHIQLCTTKRLMTCRSETFYDIVTLSMS